MSHRGVVYGAPLALALILAYGSGIAGPPQAPAPPPPPAVDDEFLEFLGTVDSEPIRPEDLWLVDYWSRPDPNKPRPPPPKPAPPPSDAKPAPPPAGQNNG